jgi:hypothetical protein
MSSVAYIFGMAVKTDYRDYLVDHPSCREAAQVEHLDGVVYTDFDKLLRSIRPGTIVRVYRPMLLGGASGCTDKRRRIWAERADAIKARHGKLVSIHPPLSGARLAMRAAEEIGNIARGAAGTSKPGRPGKTYSPEVMAVIEHYWPPRRGKTVAASIAEINRRIAPRKVTRGWLYGHLGKE